MKKIIKFLSQFFGMFIPKMETPVIWGVYMTQGGYGLNTIKFPAVKNASEYKIYRKDGTWVLKTTIAGPGSGILSWNDTTAHGCVKEYKISAKDSISPYAVKESGVHSGTYLTVSEGLGGVWNLSWSNYVNGDDGYFSHPETWIISRGCSTNGYEEILDMIPGDSYTFTDSDPDPTKLYYKVYPAPTWTLPPFDYDKDYDGRQGVTNDGSNRVSKWANVAREGIVDLFQTVDAQKPVYDATNKRLNFTRTNSQFMAQSGNYVTESMPFTQVAVIRPKTASINQMIMYGANIRECGMWLQNGNNFYFQNVSNIAVTKDGGGNITWDTNTKYICIYIWDGANSECLINGVHGYAASTPGNNGFTPFTVGKGYYGDYLDCYVNEIIWFDARKSWKDQIAIWNVMDARWNHVYPV
jgi:hypothetical protein